MSLHVSILICHFSILCLWCDGAEILCQRQSLWLVEHRYILSEGVVECVPCLIKLSQRRENGTDGTSPSYSTNEPVIQYQ